MPHKLPNTLAQILPFGGFTAQRLATASPAPMTLPIGGVPPPTPGLSNLVRYYVNPSLTTDA